MNEQFRQHIESLHPLLEALLNSVPFAFRLAREARKVPKATYKALGSRAHLLQAPEFALAFTEAKARLRAMNIRVVEESNPFRQALLEMYVALAAPYNDFVNH